MLSRRKKNNPVPIGEPGVGKSAIAEGLALRIVQRKVSRVLSTSASWRWTSRSLVAGTKYRGQFEERMKAVMNELENSPDAISSSTRSTPSWAPAAQWLAGRQQHVQARPGAR